jgi:hypothetical protein
MPAAWIAGTHGAQLLAEDLHQGFVLSLVYLCEGLLDQRPIFKAAVVQHFVQTEGGVTEQDFGTLEPLVVV